MINSEELPVPPVLGGAIEQTLFETATGIQNPRMTVISVWSKYLTAFDSHTFYHVDIAAEARAVERALGNDLPPELADYQKDKLARQFYYVRGVKSLISDIQPDVIQIHNRPELVPDLAEAFPNRKMVLYMHNEPGSYNRGFMKETVAQTSHYVFVSHFLADRFSGHFPEIPEHLITVIHNSVDTDHFHPKKRHSKQADQLRKKYNLRPNRTVLFVGRTVPSKGVDNLLDALDIVRKALPDVKLLVVGSPFFGSIDNSGYLGKLKECTDRMVNAVIFTGFVGHEHIPDYHAVSDLAVAPSRWHEPFGKVVIEAMAAGTPIVASRRGGIPELIEHHTDGVLIDNPQDVQTLATCITDLLNSPEKRNQLANHARRNAEQKFSTTVRFDCLRSLYARFS